MDDEVLYEADGPLRIITINRPAAANAVNEAVRRGMREAWAAFEADADARVAILTGAGSRIFCAGIDLREMAELGTGLPPPDFFPVPNDVVSVSKPTIAAVNGIAFAGGWRLAQSCDLCVAADHALFAITEAKVGRGVPWAATLLPMLPQRIMMELVLTGAPMTAQRLLDLGYLNRVVPAAGLLEAAKELARTIAANAPLTVRAARAMVYQTSGLSRDEAVSNADALFAPVYASADAQEGPRAFAEKRAPRWTGR